MSNHDHDDDEHEDGCLCDLEHEADEITSDEELPEAQGGVAAVAVASDADAEDVDGCDIDFNEGEVTADADLPAAAGGVA